jgi:hypothetical protein
MAHSSSVGWAGAPPASKTRRPGIWPGERLQEILLSREKATVPIGIEGTVVAKSISPQPCEAGSRRSNRDCVARIVR